MAERLRELRAERGYSQQGMAKLAQVSQSTWSSWERETPEQFAALRRLAEELEKSTDYLLGITDDPTPAAKRDEWTPEAIAAVSLVNELPAAKRGAALVAFQAIIELTQVTELEPAAAPANVGGGVTLFSQQGSEGQNDLSMEKDTWLALLKTVLSPEDYQRLEDSVNRGEMPSQAEIARLVESGKHNALPKNPERFNHTDLVN